MHESQNIVFVVPMKPSVEGKTRLAGQFTIKQRSNLVIEMLRQVISAIHEASDGLLWVVGGDVKIRNLVRNLGAQWMDDLGGNLNDTLSKAVDLVFERGKSMLYVAGDLPFLEAKDIYNMLLASQGCRNISLAPAWRDGGTNCILVPYGISFRPCLGGNSFIRHISQAVDLGVPVAICTSSGLGYDLDTLADIKAYQLLEPDLLSRLS
jgi:2-phospho-L-lactate guanylyltransferase